MDWLLVLLLLALAVLLLLLLASGDLAYRLLLPLMLLCSSSASLSGWAAPQFSLSWGCSLAMCSLRDCESE